MCPMVREKLVNQEINTNYSGVATKQVPFIIMFSFPSVFIISMLLSCVKFIIHLTANASNIYEYSVFVLFTGHYLLRRLQTTGLTVSMDIISYVGCKQLG